MLLETNHFSNSSVNASSSMFKIYRFFNRSYRQTEIFTHTHTHTEIFRESDREREREREREIRELGGWGETETERILLFFELRIEEW
jgi:hypothetical protein